MSTWDENVSLDKIVYLSYKIVHLGHGRPLWTRTSTLNKDIYKDNNVLLKKTENLWIAGNGK